MQKSAARQHIGGMIDLRKVFEKLEAATGFEPVNNGFAVSLSNLPINNINRL